MHLYDLHQNHRISKTEHESRRAVREIEDNKEEFEALRKSVQKLSLVCKAMWQLLQENCDLPEEMLEAKLQQLEKAATPQSSNCPKCGRVRQKRMPNCFYCGTAFAEVECTDYFQV